MKQVNGYYGLCTVEVHAHIPTSNKREAPRDKPMASGTVLIGPFSSNRERPQVKPVTFFDCSNKTGVDSIE